MNYEDDSDIETIPADNGYYDSLCQQVIQWEQSHRKPGVVPSGATTGFGPSGIHSLFLLANQTVTAMEFKDGKAVERQVATADEIPGLQEMRMQILGGCKHVEELIFDAPKLLLDYTSLLIRHSYNVTDEDLTFLLLGGTKWADSMIRHVLAGENFARKLAATSSDELTGAYVALRLAQQNEQSAQAATTVPPPVPKWRRALNKLRREK